MEPAYRHWGVAPRSCVWRVDLGKNGREGCSRMAPFSLFLLFFLSDSEPNGIAQISVNRNHLQHGQPRIKASSQQYKLCQFQRGLTHQSHFAAGQQTSSCIGWTAIAGRSSQLMLFRCIFLQQHRNRRGPPAWTPTGTGVRREEEDGGPLHLSNQRPDSCVL